VFGRTRRLTPKLAALAQFTVEHDNLGWSEQLGEWNADSSGCRSRSSAEIKVTAYRQLRSRVSEA